PVAGRDVVKAVEPAMPESVQARGGELAADHVAERPVERREHRRVVGEGEWQERQRARRCDAAEGRAGEIEIERPLLHIGEHLRVGTEPAFREHIEPALAGGVAAYYLRHLGETPRGRAVRRLVDAEAVMEAGRFGGAHVMEIASSLRSS